MKLMFYLNIIVRLLTVILGILIVSNIIGLKPEQLHSVQWMGYALIVFGTLRLLWYIIQFKKNEKPTE